MVHFRKAQDDITSENSTWLWKMDENGPCVCVCVIHPDLPITVLNNQKVFKGI